VLAVARHALAWQVAAFMGLQSLSFYASLSWFSTMFRDHGIGAVQAGNLIALMTVGNGITGLIVPMLAHRARDQRLLAAVAVGLIAIGLAGSAFGPNAAVAGFVALLGLGQGAAFGLSVFLFTARAADSRSAAALSGFSQGTGYLVASAGPLLIGYLHALSHGWVVPVLALLACAAGQLAAGLLAGRELTLPPLPSRP
jgi:CP family cyanate transporter-like MFS transporter